MVDYMPEDANKANTLYGWLRTSWDNGKSGSFLHKMKLAVALTASASWKRKRLQAFSQFRSRYINLTPYCPDEKAIAALELDTLICGSDQIWNPDITDGLDPLFYGDVSGVQVRISYAASLGRAALEKEDEIRAADLIGRLDACSVREEASKDYVQQLSGRETACVCDPVFLLDKASYEALTPCRMHKKPYVLLYSVVSNPQMTELAVQYARQKNFELIELCAGKQRGAIHKQICGIGPLEFLNYFRYAETVITNSFHGTAFAIIFQKEFYAVDNKARGSRISNLLQKAGLSHRMIDALPSAEDNPIDYTAVRDNMAPYIADSKSFLENALSCKKMPVIEKNCTGCGVCQAVCSKDAITLIKNREGFLQADINLQKCVSCGLCRKACPSQKEPFSKDFIQETWAFKAEDTIRQTSTSGGAFSALANAVLEQEGSVFAVGTLKNNQVQHCRCTSAEDIAAVRGVKYIQSDFSFCYQAVAADLLANKSVLVTGTPCQIAGMRAFAEQQKLPTDNLYLADIICHGIPSPAVFQHYMAWLEKKYGSKINRYDFRSKAVSWRGVSCKAVLADGRQLENTRELACFLNTYYSGNITNEACYACPYARTERVSDVTVSDYWGIENCLPDFEDQLGVSMVLINTQKGKSLFNRSVGQKQPASLTAAKQPQLKTPCQRPADRDMFWSQYFSQDIEKTFKQYGGYGNLSFRSKLYKLVKKLCKGTNIP